MSRRPHQTKSVLGHYSVGLAIGASILWLIAGAVLGSRLHNIFVYDTFPSLPPYLEPFGAPNSLLVALTLVCSVAIGAIVWPMAPTLRSKKHQANHTPSEHPTECVARTSSILSATYWLALSSLPLWLCIARAIAPDVIFQPNVWEVIWFAFATSRGAYYLAASFPVLPRSGQASHATRYSRVMVSLCLCATAWWFCQSLDYYQSFRLGFNDFAHFSQRIANTASGRGFLLETPVLPPFWDHFNPGLLLLVPLWKIWPSVYLIFVIQAVSLTIPAWLLYSISRKKGESPAQSILWGMAWLLHPCVGQMNLSYTYGWHPVTMALPFLLLGFRLLMSGKNLHALFAIILAMSFEEGVIVVVGCFSAAMLARSWWTQQRTDAFGISVSATAWGAMWLLSIVLFVLVYSLSGLAPFQAGRFARLGNNLVEVVLSPILRPVDFGALLFRGRNAIFLAIVLLPALIVSHVRSLWYWAAAAMPLGVLIVWEHMPAQSIAFQYPACLLPILFLAALASVCGSEANAVQQQDLRPFSKPIAAMAACFVLSVYVGQFPWSQSTLSDVLGKTYGFDTDLNRLAGERDNKWITQKTQSLIADAGREVRVLATGRLASHCVGLADIETVGQFWQRRDSLSKLDPALKSPLLRYDFLLLDYQENFQQTTEESRQIAAEAQSLGFTLVDHEYNFEIYRR